MPAPNLDYKSPYQKLFRRAPNYTRLRIFGCQRFPWLRPYTKNKMEDRSKSCVFLGYSTSQSAYLCIHEPTKRVYTSRHVVFEENILPFSGSSTDQTSTTEAETTVPHHNPMVTKIPLRSTPPLPPIEVVPFSDPHRASSSISSPSLRPQQAQVLPSIPKSRHSSSQLNSEPTAPQENVSRPTAQLPQTQTPNTEPSQIQNTNSP